MKDYSVIIGDKMISVFVDGIPYMFERGTKDAEQLMDTVRAGGSKEEIMYIINMADMKLYCDGLKQCPNVNITDDNVYIDGEEIPSQLVRYIRTIKMEGISIEPVVNFIRKLRENPSYRIREQLWSFMQASQDSGSFTLADDGDIIGYKKVRGNYTDIHTGTIDNSIGSVVCMDRKDVNDDPNVTCSSGLHFCAYSYIPKFSSNDEETDRIVLVKVNPRDVVSIPNDYGNAKARCCRYEVIKEITSIVSEPVIFKDRKEKEKKEISPLLLTFNVNTHALTKKELVQLYNSITGQNRTFKKRGRGYIICKIREELDHESSQ